jgi:methyl-accepting chemotaxis protein
MVLAVLFGIGSLVPAFRALSRLRRNLTASSPLARSEPSVLKDLTAAFLKLSAAYKRLASGVARALLSVRNQTGLAEDINAEFSKIVRGAQKTSEGAAAGHGKTRSGGTSLSKTLEKMRRGVEEMRSLEGRAARIEEVIGLITDVADQTELISINAAIEAARAGEAGTGFNLVAQQVRKLADRSTRAASEISDLLGNVMVCVKKVSSSANESFAAVSAVQKEMTDVSAALNDFSDAASETASEAGRAGASLASLLTFARQSMSDAEAAAASNAVVEKVIREIEGITDRVAVVREPMAEPGSAGAPSGRISADGRQAAGEEDGAPGEEDVEELEAVEESETPER